MSARKSLFHVWKIVLVYYIFSFCTIAIIFLWLGWQGAITLALIELFLHISWWIDLKSKLLKNLPSEFRCSPTHIEQFPGLDLDSLYRYNDILKPLGFIQVVDYRSETGTGFARVFAHPQHYCFADVFQVLPAGKQPLPMVCTIHSYLENDWKIVTTVVQPDGLNYMWRSNKTLWTYYKSANPAELFQIHLERRQKIIENLGLEILTDLSWEFYFIQEQKASIKRRENFARKNIVIALIEATRFEMNPVSEWLGDYPKLAARRRSRK